MGVGFPEDLVEGVARGVDLFDCVAPTRMGRNGALFTRDGRREHQECRLARSTRAPLDPDCDCAACTPLLARLPPAPLRHRTRSSDCASCPSTMYISSLR